MVRAFAVHQLLFGLESLAALAIKAFVFPSVNVAVVEHLLNELATAGVVARLARLNEIVVADFECAPHFLELPRHLVAIFLRAAVQLGGALRDPDSVFVISHQEKDLESLHAPISSLNIGADL